MTAVNFAGTTVVCLISLEQSDVEGPGACIYLGSFNRFISCYIVVMPCSIVINLQSGPLCIMIDLA